MHSPTYKHGNYTKLMIHDLHFWILTCLHKNHSFSLALPSEVIAINELDSFAPKLHNYTTFFILQYIFHKIFQVKGEYRFFFCLIYIYHIEAYNSDF